MFGRTLSEKDVLILSRIISELDGLEELKARQEQQVVDRRARVEFLHRKADTYQHETAKIDVRW